MDRSKASLLKASLTGLALLCMASWGPYTFSYLRWLLETLPSVVSSIVAPKCLFVFSNIIVLFLASESKVTQRSSNDNYAMSAIHEATMLALPVMEGKDTDHVGEESKEEQEANVVVINENQPEDQCEDGEVSAVVGDEEIREKGNNSALVEESQELQEEEVQKYDEELEEMGLPTDELNRRVEDFIARFNMERQLEARMIVCCC